jgi:ABC-type uncharacterized transport system substrate-binding protein
VSARPRPCWPRRLAWVLGVLLGAAPAAAPAHPHAYVVYSVVLPLGPRGLEAIGLVFTFDPLYSAVILADAGRADPPDAAAHARILRQLPWEIELTFNGAPVAAGAPTGLQVAASGAQVTYRFLLPLATPLRPPGTLDITVEDHGYFLAFALRAAAPVEIVSSGEATASCARARTPTGAPGPLRCQYVGPGVFGP